MEEKQVEVTKKVEVPIVRDSNINAFYGGVLK